MSAVAAAQMGLVDAIGRGGFAQLALAALQPAVQAMSWSVYTLHHGQAPVLHLSATQEGVDHTRDCFAAYARGLYLRDSSFDRVRRQPRPETPLITWMAADAAPNRDHREAIYRAHQLRERLSVAALQADGSLLAVNLYHHEPQGPFSPAERERFQDLAGLLHTAVRRQLDLAAAAVPAWPCAMAEGQLPQALGTPRERLLAAAPGLTPASWTCASACCAAGAMTAWPPTWACRWPRLKPTAPAPSPGWGCTFAASCLRVLALRPKPAEAPKARTAGQRCCRAGQAKVVMAGS